MKTLNFKKAVALTVLTLTPALALTSSAQAAPGRNATGYRSPVSQRNNPAPAWNNNARYNAPRFDARSNQNQRFDQYRNDARFDARRNEGRFDQRRDNDNGNGNDTAKIIGAGIVGAILGAVLSR